MFSIEQIDDPHARLGSARTFPEYVQALKPLGDVHSIKGMVSVRVRGRNATAGR